MVSRWANRARRLLSATESTSVAALADALLFDGALGRNIGHASRFDGELRLRACPVLLFFPLGPPFVLIQLVRAGGNLSKTRCKRQIIHTGISSKPWRLVLPNFGTKTIRPIGGRDSKQRQPSVPMLIQAGFHLHFDVKQPQVPMLLRLEPFPSKDIRVVDGGGLQFSPAVDSEKLVDQFGNRTTRICALQGPFDVRCDTTFSLSEQPDPVAPAAEQLAVEELPVDVLPYLLASRYCEVDGSLNDFAWRSFGRVPPGWARVQAVCDFVHRHLRFDYVTARPTRTAEQAFVEMTGVCRDFSHLAITLCRSLNIPARYAAGYLGDIRVPPLPSPMDFSAWFEVYLSGCWYTFDARFNVPRVGRIVMARGRDATDVAFATLFGSAALKRFEVWTDEVDADKSRRCDIELQKHAA
jgi:transglutaminase-like putative cysteine protease